MADRYIVIPKWDDLQHYKNVDRPAWIKSYTKLLNDHRYLELTGNQRALLHGLWLLYAMSGRRVPLDLEMINRKLSLSAKMASIEALNKAGLIHIRSRPDLGKVYAREEKIRKETPLPPFHLNGRSKKTCDECSVGGGLHLVDCSQASKVVA
jgi:hypothetical protein